MPDTPPHDRRSQDKWHVDRSINLPFIYTVIVGALTIAFGLVLWGNSIMSGMEKQAIEIRAVATSQLQDRAAQNQIRTELIQQQGQIKSELIQQQGQIKSELSQQLNKLETDFKTEFRELRSFIERSQRLKGDG